MTPELLQRFSATENDIRYYLQKPWRSGGFIYATNGHLLVEIPDDGRATCVEGTKSHPLTRKLLDGKPILSAFVSMPDLLPASETGLCKVCDGHGAYERIECSECDGEGDFEHGSHTYECMACGGSGMVGKVGTKTLCLACDGYGEPGNIPEAHRTEVKPGVGYQTRYLRLFSLLPGVRIAPGGSGDPCHVIFDGGRGMLMPMHPTPASKAASNSTNHGAQ